MDRQVISQAQRSVLAGQKVPAAEKLVRLFEPHTRIIPRHKGGRTSSLGDLSSSTRRRGGIVTRFAVLAGKTAEQGQLAPALDHDRQVFGRAPRLVMEDRGLHGTAHDRVARAAGGRPR